MTNIIIFILCLPIMFGITIGILLIGDWFLEGRQNKKRYQSEEEKYRTFIANQGKVPDKKDYCKTLNVKCKNCYAYNCTHKCHIGQEQEGRSLYKGKIVQFGG